MSVVTSIIILFPYSEDERDSLENPTNCYSGTKSFNSVVLLASYNNFPEEAFLEVISSAVNWLDADSVQVFLNSEKFNDKSFRVYSNAGKNLASDSVKW